MNDYVEKVKTSDVENVEDTTTISIIEDLKTIDISIKKEEVIAFSGSIEPDVEYYNVPLSEDLQDYIFELCGDYGIDPAIIIGMINQESRFTADAIGDSGNSLGLMQIQPQWNYDRMNRLGCPDLLDPYQNVTVGIDILAYYLNQSGSIEYSLMAYNGGPTYASNMWNSGQISSYASSIINYANNLETN